MRHSSRWLTRAAPGLPSAFAGFRRNGWRRLRDSSITARSLDAHQYGPTIAQNNRPRRCAGSSTSLSPTGGGSRLALTNSDETRGSLRVMSRSRAPRHTVTGNTDCDAQGMRSRQDHAANNIRHSRTQRAGWRGCSRRPKPAPLRRSPILNTR